MSVYETDLEASCLGWLSGLGYEVLESDNLDPSTVYDERDALEDVVLTGRLRGALSKLNPELNDDLIEEAMRRIMRRDWPTLEQNNLEFHRLLANGLELETANEQGGVRGVRVRLFDFDDPDENDWVACNQVDVVDRTEGTGNRRRADVVIWVNGLPLAALELKNPASANANIWDAYNQLQTYKRDIPSLFATNEVLVISDDVLSRLGSLTADRARFQPWRAAEHEKDVLPSEKAATFEHGERLERLVRGVFEKERFLDLVRNFITFETVDGKLVKIVAAYHQFHAVRLAVEKTRAALAQRTRKVGVVWHTQGSGKSLTMLFYVRRLVLDPALDNPTIVVITDRNDLDDQLFGTFSRSQELLRQEPIRAKDRKHLRELLRTSSGGVYFTTIQKFLPDDIDAVEALSDRHNVVVIADEAHRSQYGLRAKVDRKTGEISYGLAKHMRDALPNAAFIGFTGTPIELEDKNTIEVFGNYVSIYDIQQAVEDEATVPIYYENRLAKLQLLEEERPNIDPQFEELTEGEEASVKEGLKTEWSSLEALVGSDKRVKQIASDIVAHFERRQGAAGEGKAMIVCMSRRICVEMYNAIAKLRPDWAAEKDDEGEIKVVMTGTASDTDWQTHIRSGSRLKELADRFKKPKDPFKIVIVCDMWLTGFDAPSLHTLYVDKPMRGHNLMQAIARVNRVFGEKRGGLVVDYIGIAPFLKDAMKTYTQSGGKGDATFNQQKAWDEFLAKLEVCRGLFAALDTTPFFRGKPEDRLRVLAEAREHILRRRVSGDPGKRTASKGAPADEYELFLKTAAELSRLAGLVAAFDQFDTFRAEVAFYQAVRAGLIKLSPGKSRPTSDLQHGVRQIVANAIVSDHVIDVFEAAGLPKPDISVLSPEFLAEVAGMQQKNLAAALLERILRDQIRARRRESVIQARSFEDLLERAVQQYLNRSVDVTQVIQALLDLAAAMREAARKAEALGLTRDEYAFYEALADNESAKEVLGDKVLSQMAHELTTLVRKNATIDWEKKKSVQAQLRVLVKRLLKKYQYPPDAQERAVSTVLEQARTLGINIVEGAPAVPLEAADQDEVDGDDRVPHELPYPLAAFEPMVLAQESKTLRVKTMMDAIERAISFTAVCILAHLRELNGGSFPKAVLDIIGKDPGKPISMGTWNEYLLRSAKLLASDDSDPIAHVARVFVGPNGKPTALADEVSKEVLPYRNTFAHGVTVDEGQVLEHEQPIQAVWHKLLKALSRLRETELATLASIDDVSGQATKYKMRRHQGAQPHFPLVDFASNAKLVKSWSYLLRPGKPPLSLAPFIACEYVKEAERRELLIARTIALQPGEKVDLVGVASQAKCKLVV